MAEKEQVSTPFIPAPKSQGRVKDGTSEPKPRLSVPLSTDGTIEWESMRTDTREKLRKAVSDPRLSAELGAATGVTPDGAFDPKVIAFLYNGIGLLATSIARSMGYSADDAKLLEFTSADLDQLIPASGPVLAKYAGAISEYDAELGLAAVLFAVGTSKYMAIKDRPRNGVIEHGPVAASRETTPVAPTLIPVPAL